MKDILLELLPYVAAFIGGVLVWFKDRIATSLGLKKEEKEIESSSLDNIQKNIDLYQELLNDLDERYKKRLKEIEESFEESMVKLKGDLNSLNDLNIKLIKINTEQKTLIQKLQKSLKYFQDNCLCLDIDKTIKD